MKNGYISFQGYKTYYKIFGEQEGNKPPLLILHGGPGSTHNYVLKMRNLAKSGRQVVFFDQFGCGKSEGRDEQDMWVIKTFVDQINAVRDALNLTEIHLLGHSWGGMLAIEYMLTRPKGVHGVVLSSAMVSLPLYQEEVDKLVAKLPKPFSDYMIEGHRAGKFDGKQYLEAYDDVYNKYHLFRGDKWLDDSETPEGERNVEQYKKMWGPDESYIKTGDLKDWDVIDRLPEITNPTLVISGQYDELTPHQNDITHKQIKGSEQYIVEDASHCHFIEQEAKSLGAVDEFLSKLD